MGESRNKIYFASDFHLGFERESDNHTREITVVKWLSQIQKDAAEVYLLGDIFDFWFEYKTVIPKGFTRFLGKIAEMVDSGIAVTIFKGNHDMWMFGYLEKELGVKIISDELCIERAGKKFFLHHGDGLGKGEFGYKFIKFIFRNTFFQWLFARFHPNFGIRLAKFLSAGSRKANYRSDLEYKGDDNEFLTQFALSKLKQEYFDYFIFGHRHLPLDIHLQNNSCYINLGEWVTHYTYAEFDGNGLELKTYSGNLIA
ncbi:MAG: UDP-2,3-diacylglucosamine diphosphatase [Bacteroidia bacterium]|nr:UDP-2,3-diacylglucosamine diphosphatase [Bacteroidia bacterium]